MKLIKKLAFLYALTTIAFISAQDRNIPVNDATQGKMFDYIVDTYFYLIDNPDDLAQKDYENIKTALGDFIKKGANINTGRPVYDLKGNVLGYGPPLLFVAIENGYKKIVAAILEYDSDITFVFKSINPRTKKTEDKDIHYYISRSGKYKADFQKAFENLSTKKKLTDAEKRKLITDLLK